MITDQQLRETALRVVLDVLTGMATYHRDSLAEALCQYHCTDETCRHDPAESDAEISAVRAQIADAVNHLRGELSNYALIHDVDLPTT